MPDFISNSPEASNGQADAAGESTQPDRIAIARFKTARRAHEYGLVILSMRSPYWVEQREGVFYLVVNADKAQSIREQLRLYRRESRNWPPAEPVFPESKGSFTVSIAWVAILVISHAAALRWPWLVDWGMVSAEAVMNGDWYRVLTALLLHGDISHLTGNSVMGAFFLYFLVRQIRPWQALTGTFAAGAIGNFLNVLLYYPEPHYSIGASTAVFAAIAMLISVPLGVSLRLRWWSVLRTWAVPIGGGAILLAWFGTGDVNTDVTAHLTGFFSGIPIGLTAGFFSVVNPAESADEATVTDDHPD